MARLGLQEGQIVSLYSQVEDGNLRQVDGLRVTAYDLPDGTVAGYYPELNPSGSIVISRKKLSDASIQRCACGNQAMMEFL